MNRCVVVIPTCRAGPLLERTLRSLSGQTWPPERVVVVDASQGLAAGSLCQQRWPMEVEHRPFSGEPSAARQRNEGAKGVKTSLVGFFDDDIELSPDVLEKLCRVWEERSETGGVAARIEGMEHPVPKMWLRAYYRMQAGYDHPHYGGHLFGAAINCLPAYGLEKGELIPAMWLNSGCVVYRTEVFAAERFPDFAGESFLEDVHLSARVARKWPLFFHAGAWVKHLDGGRSGAGDPARRARDKIWNRRRVAEEVLGLRGWELAWKLSMHRLFASVTVLHRREPGWCRELVGTWLP